MTRHSKVFVPVSVDERTPDKLSGHFIYTEDNFQETKVAQSLDAAMFEPEKNEFDFSDEDGGEYRAQPTHWLEEKENVYVLTEDELNEEKRKASVLFLSWYEQDVLPFKKLLPESEVSPEQLYQTYLTPNNDTGKQ